jgi:hypothetical protein
MDELGQQSPLIPRQSYRAGERKVLKANDQKDAE